MANKIIVAGRTQYELFNIDDNQFSYKARYVLQGKAMLRLMDISWSRFDESLIVSCGSNGKLYKLIVNESELINPTPSDEQIVFHESTINKIQFHPNEPNLLIRYS